MYCEQCGKWNEDGRKNCFSCGSPLRVEKMKAEEEKSPKAGKEKKQASSADLAAMEKELHQLNQKGKPILAFVIACLVLVGIVMVLVDQIPERYGAKRDAEIFETAMLSGQWEQAFSCLYMPDETSPMLTEAVFVDVMNHSGASGFRNLELEEVNSTPEQKVFKAVYDTAEETQKTDYLTMCPTGNKKFLFMKEWKVDPVTVCVDDVTIIVPDDAEMLLNGLSPVGDSVGNSESYTVEYRIPKMFAGSWTVELQAEHRVPYYEDIQVSDDNTAFSFEGVEMEPDQALMDSLIQQFGQDYQAILEASVNQEDFSVVEQYFTNQAIQEGRAQTLYANGCSQAFDPERGTGIIRYELSDMTGTLLPLVKSGYAVAGDVVMEIHTGLSRSYIKDGMELSETKDSTGLLCLHQEDGRWKIQSFS